MEVRKTDDGSPTIWSEQYGETYHSGFGAVTESMHVFIEQGFKLAKANPVSVFEMGFGTGLNAFLTQQAACAELVSVKYHAVELHPVPMEIAEQLELTPETRQFMLRMHEAEWNKPNTITPGFELLKINNNFLDWDPDCIYHLVYYDAFSPESQPELWTQEVFHKIYRMLCPGGILTTYCAKGYVRRYMTAAGFKVERLPGPPGKREMLRAVK
jgi:tRNA U34 5-methylaminomethyl-2-thiouridine-forming methyltransferase MnmC